MLSSTDSGNCDSCVSTPHRVQKRLFIAGGSSSKRNLFHAQKTPRKEGAASGDDESDLGPMSPLALTDQGSSSSSCCSSPGRQFVSPFATPEKSPRSVTSNGNSNGVSWDRLCPSSGNPRGRSESMTPFSLLKKCTRTARSSPRRHSTRPRPSSQQGCLSPKSFLPASPLSMENQDMEDEIVPETPERKFGRDLQNEIIKETPQKEAGRSPQIKLITPLASVGKEASLPRLHRRKSLGLCDLEADSSPERRIFVSSGKRHAQDVQECSRAKLQKLEDYSWFPKARAALFQSKQESTLDVKPIRPNALTLSTKSFYSSSKPRQSLNVEARIEKVENEEKKKRRSLPAFSGSHQHRRSLGSRRHRFGEINAGVFHGIKRPKVKRKSTDVGANKVIVKDENKKSPEPKRTAEKPRKEKKVVQRPVSPEIDPTKKFFKTNRTIRPTDVATVTVSKKFKLKVSDRKIELKQKARNVHKRPKLDLSLDATDLTVDEPEMEATVEKSKVDSILKILEDDWADDDYDTMENLMNCGIGSPVKVGVDNLAQDVMMSPASELSNMTSVMNIDDGMGATDFENVEFGPADLQDTPQKNAVKYYPLFSKGFVMNSTNDENSPRSRGIKRVAKWQLTAGSANDQYQLDAGQKRFGATTCPECGIVYQMGEPEDENAHLNYHNSIKTLKFNGWKNERVVEEDLGTQSRIILVEPDDPKQCWKKISEILAVVDRDLGLADMHLNNYQTKRIYLYIRDKTILGVLVAEEVKSAHRMIPDLIELDCCTSESTPVKCGVNVVWTTMSHRRQGIATKLVDSLRRNYYYGYVMSLDDIAFSMPTPSGKLFAAKYTKTQSFKVYN